MSTAMKPKRNQSPTAIDLGPRCRPPLSVEFEARGRPSRSTIYGKMAQVTESGETDFIVGSYWGERRSLKVTFQHIGTFDAAEVKLVDPWPNDGSQRNAELRDAVVKEFLTKHAAGRRIVDEVIRERRVAEQNRTRPATLPMVVPVEA